MYSMVIEYYIEVLFLQVISNIGDNLYKHW